MIPTLDFSELHIVHDVVWDVMEDVSLDHTNPLENMNRNQRDDVRVMLALLAQKKNMELLHEIHSFANSGLQACTSDVILTLSYYLANKNSLLYSPFDT